MKKAIILAITLLSLNTLVPSILEVEAVRTEEVESVKDSYGDMLKRLVLLEETSFPMTEDVTKLKIEIEQTLKETDLVTTEDGITLINTEERQQNKEQHNRLLKKLEELESKQLVEDKAKVEEEAKAKAEEEAKAKAEEEAKAKAEEEAKAKAEDETKAKAEEEEKAKAEDETKAKAEEEAKAKAEEEAKAKAEEEAKAKAEEEEKAKAEDETKAKAEEEEKAKAEDETKAKAEEEAEEEAPIIEVPLDFKSYEYAGIEKVLEKRLSLKISEALNLNSDFLKHYHQVRPMTEEKITTLIGEDGMTELIKTLSNTTTTQKLVEFTAEDTGRDSESVSLKIRLEKKLAVLASELVSQTSYVGYTSDVIDPHDFFENKEIIINGSKWNKAVLTSPLEKDAEGKEVPAENSWDQKALFTTKEEGFNEVRVILTNKGSKVESVELLVPVRFELKKGSIKITDSILKEPSPEDKILLVITPVPAPERNKYDVKLKIGYGDQWPSETPPLIFDPDKSDYNPLGDVYFGLKATNISSPRHMSRDFTQPYKRAGDLAVDGLDGKVMKNVEQIREALDNQIFITGESGTALSITTPNMQKLTLPFGESFREFSLNSLSRFRDLDGQQLSEATIKEQHLLQRAMGYLYDYENQEFVIFPTTHFGDTTITKEDEKINGLPPFILEGDTALSLSKYDQQEYDKVNNDSRRFLEQEFERRLVGVYYDETRNPTGFDATIFKMYQNYRNFTIGLTANNLLDHINQEKDWYNCFAYIEYNKGRIVINTDGVNIEEEYPVKYWLAAPPLVIEKQPNSFYASEPVKLTNQEKKVELISKSSSNTLKISDYRHYKTEDKLVKAVSDISISTDGFYRLDKQGKKIEGSQNNHLELLFEGQGDKSAILSANNPVSMLKMPVKGEKKEKKVGSIEFITGSSIDKENTYRVYLNIPKGSNDELLASKYEMDLTYTLPTGTAVDIDTGTPEKVGA